MTFNSWEFLLFYPIVALLYFVLPRCARWPMLLVASYFFYMCYQPELVFLIFGTTLVSWAMSMLIERVEKPSVKKLALAITLVVCFGVLFFFKYFNFLADSLVGIIELCGGTPSKVELNLILPVGISFYTFQTLSYVIDVYRGDVKTERNFFFYALFVSYFPQLVAGPIERPGNLIPQLKEEHKFNKADFTKGAKHMMVGFFKKICVADLISVYVNAVYNNAGEATAFGVILASALFAVQIYCDFSGYTDIAVGCARIMGIRLMKNFDHPYMASSIKEFWARWHISLSTWFKDYLYIPLGGSRVPRWRYLMNVMIVFLVSGLWHGAAWTFVIWGALHGFYQIVGNLTAKPRAALIKKCGFTEKSAVVLWVRRVNTFILVAFSWIFFRANSTADALHLVKTLFTGWNVPLTEAFSRMELGLVGILMTALSVLTLVMLERLLVYEDFGDGSEALTKDFSFAYFIWIVAFCWALLLSKDMTSSFIYFQF